MTVNIKGKEYVTVAERINAYTKDEPQGGISSILTYDDNFVRCSATVKTKRGRFTGHAEEKRGGNDIAGQSPTEVCETSAVGRALGFAGYGVIDSIASAEEVLAKVTPTILPITQKQIEYISRLTNARKITAEATTSYLIDKFKVENIKELNSKQASFVIDDLLSNKIPMNPILISKDQSNKQYDIKKEDVEKILDPENWDAFPTKKNE